MRNIYFPLIVWTFLQVCDTSAQTINAQDKTIDWYMAHTTERKDVIKTCDNDPGHLKDDPDCINAKEADHRAGVDDVKKGIDDTVDGAANFFHNLGK